MSAKSVNRDFIKSLMQRSGKEKETVIQFMGELQNCIDKGLQEDGVVKISGLGTFKLVLVEPRKSVNVRTGEAMQISSHYKLSYTPDASLRDMVNEPLSHLEPVELQDGEVYGEPDSNSEGRGDTENAKALLEDSDDAPLHKLTEQAIELKSILMDIQGGLFVSEEAKREESHQVEEAHKDNQQTVPTEEEEPEKEVEPEEEEPEQTDEGSGDKTEDVLVISGMLAEQAELLSQIQNVDSENDKEVNEVDLEPDKREEGSEYIQDREESPQIVNEQKNETSDVSGISAADMLKNVKIESKKRRGPWLYIYVTIAAIAVIVSAIWVLFNPLDNMVRIETEKVSEEYAESEVKMVSDTVSAVDSEVNELTTAETADTLSANIQEKQDSIVETETLMEPEEDTAEALVVAQYSSSSHIEIFDKERRYNEFTDTILISEGSRLTWIALKVFGSKEFWPYLYEANMDHLSDPNNISVGTPIRIPKIPKELIDATNQECIKYARELHKYYVK